MCFFVVCPYGHILERVIFSWFAQTGLYVTYEKKKNHASKGAVVSWFAHVGLYVTYVGGKGRSNKRKNHVLESVVFSWFAHTGLHVTYEEKTSFWKVRGCFVVAHVKNVFFVVCPYGPLRPLCGGQGRK